MLEVFATLLPSDVSNTLPDGADRAPLGGFVDDLFQSAPSHVLWGLRVCLWLIVLSPPFVLGRFATFFGLEHAERIEVLEHLQESNVYVVREMPLLFKTTACLGYCGLPSVQRAVGFRVVDETPPDWAEGGDR